LCYFLAQETRPHDFACYSCALPHSFHESGKLLKALYKLNRRFFQDALPGDLIGMNSTLMWRYFEFCADRLTIALRQQRIYGVSNHLSGWKLSPSNA
jgi:ribonucleotide reductase beta subunit family protein with ferritin-like domain